MLNTCSIGRRWKSREGWSRPVLTGERGTLFPIPLGDWVSSCGGFLVGWQGTLFLVVTTIGKAFIVRVRCPVPGPPRSESVVWLVPLPAALLVGVGRSEWFCGGHGPGETPGPFPNPEAKAWHGDGTALERVWESSAPPHSHVGGSRRASAPGTPFFYALLCRPAGRSPSPGGRKAFPVPGRLGLFRASKGNFCCSTKTSGEQILFSERAFDTVYDTVF